MGGTDGGFMSAFSARLHKDGYKKRASELYSATSFSWLCSVFFSSIVKYPSVYYFSALWTLLGVTLSLFGMSRIRRSAGQLRQAFNSTNSLDREGHHKLSIVAGPSITRSRSMGLR